MIYSIVVGAILLFCFLLAAIGGVLFFVMIGAFLWMVVTGKWDNPHREYQGNPIRPVIFKGQSWE